MALAPSELTRLVGDIDIYLFDQMLRGRLTPGMRVLDAGCGAGRNIMYLLHAGFEVFASDASADAIASVQSLAATRAPHLPRQLPRRADRGDGVARQLRRRRDQQCRPPLRAGRRAVRRHDAADVGCPEARRHAVLPPGVHNRHGTSCAAALGRWHQLPDGSERYLVDEAMLLALTARLGGVLLDPLKTTVVQDQRSMTTWVVAQGTPATSGMTGCGRPAAVRRSRDRTLRPASPWSCRYRAAG